jgi:hypothetical protein
MIQSTVSDRSARWRGLLAKQSSSGLSIAAFCRREGVALSTFHWWKRKLTVTGGRREPRAVDWVEARPLLPPPLPGDAAVRLGNARGIWIEFASCPAPDVLRATLHALHECKGGASC